MTPGCVDLDFAPNLGDIAGAAQLGRRCSRDRIVLHKAFQSSGDMIADRRADYARMLSDNRDHQAAAELMGQALELVPDWVAGWDLLGSFSEKAGDLAGAIAAWRHVEALDEEGIFGADLKLAAHGAGRLGEGTAVSYVEALFDQYAPRFEASLVGKLGYQVPDLLAAMVADESRKLGLDRFAQALDLGCGTGLMGERLRARVSFLEGIDLSAAMVAETRRKGTYDRVEKAELVAYLHQQSARFDLLTAADVFIYCGALEPVLAAAAQSMAPGALLAFSVEAHEGPEPVFLQPSLRYAHAAEPTREAVRGAGLDVLRFETAVLRSDRGEPVTGLLIVARKATVAPIADSGATETAVLLEEIAS